MLLSESHSEGICWQRSAVPSFYDVLLKIIMQSASAEVQSAPRSGGWRAPPKRHTAAGTETTAACPALAVPALFEAGRRLACGAAALGPPANLSNLNYMFHSVTFLSNWVYLAALGSQLSVERTGSQVRPDE